MIDDAAAIIIHSLHNNFTHLSFSVFPFLCISFKSSNQEQGLGDLRDVQALIEHINNATCLLSLSLEVAFHFLVVCQLVNFKQGPQV